MFLKPAIYYILQLYELPPVVVVALLTLFYVNSTPDSPVSYTNMVAAFDAATLMEKKEEQNLEIQQLQDHYKSLNWITDLLLEDITSLYPSSPDIDLANNNPKNLAVFKENVGKVCYPGRYSTSYIQFNQSMKLLCLQWNTSTLSTNNCVQCHYRECKQKFTLHPNQAKRRRRQVLCSGCPFIIRYFLPDLVCNKNNECWKPRLLYKVNYFLNKVFIHIKVSSYLNYCLLSQIYWAVLCENHNNEFEAYMFTKHSIDAHCHRQVRKVNREFVIAYEQHSVVTKNQPNYVAFVNP